MGCESRRKGKAAAEAQERQAGQEDDCGWVANGKGCGRARLGKIMFIAEI